MNENYQETIEKMREFEELPYALFHSYENKYKDGILRISAECLDEPVIMAFYYDEDGNLDTTRMYLASPERDALYHLHSEFFKPNYPEVKFHNDSIDIGLDIYCTSISDERFKPKVRLDAKGMIELY